MGWRRLGHVFAPPGDQPWARSHAALPTPLHLDGDLFRFFFSARDADKRSHIGWVDIAVTDPPRVLANARQPVLSPGEDGAFDDSGVSIGCVVPSDGALRLYYMGWNLGVRTRWHNAIGVALATAPDAPFVRISPGPILDRSPEDPYTLTYPWVMRREKADWRMWYGSSLTASLDDADMKHTVKTAQSTDGLRWSRDGTPTIALSASDAHVILRPSVIETGGGWLMACACRGDRYRIALFASADGARWTCLGDEADLSTSPDGWDCDMACYPALFMHRGRMWMAFNGNGYGATGFGLAVWDGPLPGFHVMSANV